MIFQSVKYIIETTTVDINHRNHKGQTALDILQQAGKDAENEHFKALLITAGGKSSKELSPARMPETQQTETLGKKEKSIFLSGGVDEH